MKVFISHSYEDRAAALRLACALEERTLEPWTSARLEPGKDWKAAITQAVSESQGFLFLVGPQSQEDRWLQVEWQGNSRIGLGSRATAADDPHSVW